MTSEELRRLATKELISYVKGAASGMCPASMDYWKEHIEETFNRIVSLEKENAELKKQQFSLRNERNTFLAQNEQYEKDLIAFNEELTKAKEIIKELLDFDFLPENEIKKKAEQFVSEVEKMTDKELAKEYVDKLYAEKVSKEDYDKDGWILYRSEDIGDAFLNGLKAGRPKWHKVADGEYPKRTGEYLTNIGVLTWDYYGDGRYGWHTEFCEHCDCMDDVDSDEVIAWCEIPKYTEE